MLLPSTHYPLHDFDLRATHARTLLPTALASVSFGFVLVRVRVLDRLRGFVVVPSSAGGNSSFELHSQSMEERATLDRYHHFHGHSGMCA